MMRGQTFDSYKFVSEMLFPEFESHFWSRTLRTRLFNLFRRLAGSTEVYSDLDVVFQSGAWFGDVSHALAQAVAGDFALAVEVDVALVEQAIAHGGEQPSEVGAAVLSFGA